MVAEHDPAARSARGDTTEPTAAGDRRRSVLTVVMATSVALGALVGAARWFGTGSRRFAFVAAWAPMTWLGTVSRVAPPRLPERMHRLRRFEQDGARLYELAGVRLVKMALRRGPIAVFNPRLHLPSDPTPARVAELDRQMRIAEASHTICFAATLGGAGVALATGRRSTARWMAAWNVLFNAYPVMLQRYNRALLARRFDEGVDAPPAGV
ncbi:MAG: hypothetical protein MUF83_06850 [Acidimicrobiales bacterium]|jgi:hypothetical protein|nr:hypothetical protein [Acidimicrobiales bacterium]